MASSIEGPEEAATGAMSPHATWRVERPEVRDPASPTDVVTGKKDYPRKFVPRRLRLVFALIYLTLILLLVNRFGESLAPSGQGIWFWTGVVLIVFGATLTEPHYSSLFGSIGNGLAVALTAIALPQSVEVWSAPQSVIRTVHDVCLAYGLLVAITGLLLVLYHDTYPHSTSRWIEPIRRIILNAGAARAAYTTLFIGTSLAAMYGQPGHLADLWITVVVMVFVRPLEWLYKNWPASMNVQSQTVLTVTGVRDPGLVEFLAGTDSMRPGDECKVGSTLVRLLDTSRSSNGTWSLGVIAEGPIPEIGAEGHLTTRPPISTAVGYIEAGTDFNELVFGVGVSVVLEQGDLVSVQLDDKEVLYQVMSAEVETQKLGPNIRHSRVLVHGAKLGAWDNVARQFVSVPWLPRAGSVVNQMPPIEEPTSPAAIGHVPGTNFSIEIDCDRLVTHGTAILGVLGVGKSTLARELIRRVTRQGCKVLILDTTPEYAIDLDDLIDESSEDVANRINTAISSKEHHPSSNMADGGNRRQFRNEIRGDIDRFLASSAAVRLYDLSKFTVSKQVVYRKDISGSDGFESCTFPELTSDIARVVFDAVKNQQRSHAHLCVVLEEGHNLVPEFTSVSAKGDERAVSQTTKVFLQGRKFGLGALLITQRTANVSKSLLTQCNTVFCFRAHDDTTENFLRGRAGAKHVSALPTLPDRRVLALGRALNAKDPLFLRVNDSKKIKELLTDSVAQAPEIDQGADAHDEHIMDAEDAEDHQGFFPLEWGDWETMEPYDEEEFPTDYDVSSEDS